MLRIYFLLKTNIFMVVILIFMAETQNFPGQREMLFLLRYARQNNIVTDGSRKGSSRYLALLDPQDPQSLGCIVDMTVLKEGNHGSMHPVTQFVRFRSHYFRSHDFRDIAARLFFQGVCNVDHPCLQVYAEDLHVNSDHQQHSECVRLGRAGGVLSLENGLIGMRGIQRGYRLDFYPSQTLGLWNALGEFHTAEINEAIYSFQKGR